jgi:hypothetical protein
VAYEAAPLPMPAGSLEPPRRRPPTAVGTEEQPPRRPRRNRYSTGPSLVRRIALRGLSSLFLLGGAVVLWPLGWQSSLGAGLVGLSVHVAHRSIVSHGEQRTIDLTQPSPEISGTVDERSA